MRRIGITMGEPAGIGPELLVRALAQHRSDGTQFVLVGHAGHLTEIAKQVRIEPFWETVSEVGRSDHPVVLFSSSPSAETPIPPKDRRARANVTLTAIDKAATLCEAGALQALVTAPIDKSIVREIRPSFTGHTSYLAERSGVPRTVMLLDNTEIRVVLVTEHIPLRNVSEVVTASLLEETIRITAKAMHEWFQVVKPRIAIAGLNPHAGELVEEAEEGRAMQPVVRKLQDEGWNIEGPFAADSLFSQARAGTWDWVVSPYHDQGLVAAKYPGLEKVVNITLGLPYLRVSPGHGVAYDIAGQGIADTRSFLRAVKIATTGRLHVDTEN